MSAQEGYMAGTPNTDIAGTPGAANHLAQIRLENFPLTASIVFEITLLQATPSKQSLRIQMETNLKEFHDQEYSVIHQNQKVLSYALQRAELFIRVKEQRNIQLQHIIKYSGKVPFHLFYQFIFSSAAYISKVTFITVLL